MSCGANYEKPDFTFFFFFFGGVLHVNSKRLCQESIKAFGVGWMKGGRGVSDLGCRKARNQTQYKFLVA